MVGLRGPSLLFTECFFLRVVTHFTLSQLSSSLSPMEISLHTTRGCPMRWDNKQACHHRCVRGHVVHFESDSHSVPILFEITGVVFANLLKQPLQFDATVPSSFSSFGVSLAAPSLKFSTGWQWANQRALSLGPASICIGAEIAGSIETRQWAAWQRPHRWFCHYPNVWSHWRFGMFYLYISTSNRDKHKQAQKRMRVAGR